MLKIVTAIFITPWHVKERCIRPSRTKLRPYTRTILTTHKSLKDLTLEGSDFNTNQHTEPFASIAMERRSLPFHSAFDACKLSN